MRFITLTSYYNKKEMLINVDQISFIEWGLPSLGSMETKLPPEGFNIWFGKIQEFYNTPRDIQLIKRMVEMNRLVL